MPLTPEVERRFGWDRASNPVSVDDGRWGKTSYRHNGNGQVLAVTDRQGKERFGYNARRQVASQQRSGDSVVVPLYGPGGRVQRFGSVLYRYDAWGRVVERRVERAGFRPRRWLYSWNADDYLSTATEPDGTRWTYNYDPFGRRTRKLSAKGGTAFLWDGDRLAQEIPLAPDGSPAPDGQATLWAWSPDGLTPVARLRGDRLHYAVSDAIGTPQELLGEDGSLAWAARHHLWGAANDQQAVDTDCPLRFPGQIADSETGLYYNRFRYYDPQTTQYLTPDPIGLNGGLRSWGYVENPAAWIDPLGLAGCPDPGLYRGRRDAFRQAKRDAGIPMSQEPYQTKMARMEKSNRKPILDENGYEIPTREYYFKRSDGSHVVIQDHTAGHKFGDVEGVGDQGRYFNVRPYDPSWDEDTIADKLRTGSVPGTQGHYSW